MNPYVISQLIDSRHADLVADASRQRQVQQARSARRAALAADQTRRPIRPLRVAAWLRTLVAALRYGRPEARVRSAGGGRCGPSCVGPPARPP